ncbi:hypothetical protein T484DRAFT_1902678, partial [Baffinella frigidus]
WGRPRNWSEGRYHERVGAAEETASEGQSRRQLHPDEERCTVHHARGRLPGVCVRRVPEKGRGDPRGASVAHTQDVAPLRPRDRHARHAVVSRGRPSPLGVRPSGRRQPHRGLRSVRGGKRHGRRPPPRSVRVLRKLPASDAGVHLRGDQRGRGGV